jgi:hypothetical protein
MLTLFSLPKPFAGPTAIHQENAIESWRRLHPDVELILFGDDAGVAEAARRFGALHVPDVARNDSGTPLLKQLFRQAEQTARHDIVGFVNADIVLVSDTLVALDIVRRHCERFLLVGRRTNLDIDRSIDFSGDWERALRDLAAARGSLHGYQGSDFFIYRRPMFDDMPDFAIGRTSWDNWIMFHARNTGAALVDGTRDLFCAHQNHDYGHIPAGGDAWKGKEAAVNLALAGGHRRIYTVYDATHVLAGGRLVSTRHPRYWPRHARAQAERLFIDWLSRHAGVHRTLRVIKQTMLVAPKRQDQPR